MLILSTRNPGPRILPRSGASPPEHPGMLASGSKVYIASSIVQKLILDPICAPSWPPLETKTSDFTREGYQKSTISLFSVLSSSELDFWWILASLEAPQESQNRKRELSKKLRDRFWTQRRLQDPIVEPNIAPKTSLRLYFGTENQPLGLIFRHL